MGNSFISHSLGNHSNHKSNWETWLRIMKKSKWTPSEVYYMHRQRNRKMQKKTKKQKKTAAWKFVCFQVECKRRGVHFSTACHFQDKLQQKGGDNILLPQNHSHWVVLVQKVIHRSITWPYILRKSFIERQMKVACCLFSFQNANNLPHQTRTIMPLRAALADVCLMLKWQIKARW